MSILHGVPNCDENYFLVNYIISTEITIIKTLFYFNKQVIKCTIAKLKFFLSIINQKNLLILKHLLIEVTI